MSKLFETATRYSAVTPSDSTIIKFKSLYIGGTGAVHVRQGGAETAVVFAAVPAGTVLPISGTQVMAATTATNIVAMDW